MTIDVAYTRWADSYDSDPNATRDLDQSATVEVLGKHHFVMAVEAGCGTGKNTLLLARISQSVLALDFSPGMLAKARARVQQPHVQFQQADLLKAWPCGDGGADLVSCNLVLEHIEHMAPIFREAARVLAPGGMFFVSELIPTASTLAAKPGSWTAREKPPASRLICTMCPNSRARRWKPVFRLSGWMNGGARKMYKRRRGC